MTHYWTKRRWASLAIHVAFVSVPFTLSTVSALLFWAAMFGGNWYLAVPMVAVIEILSLVGLVLFLTRIESPFVHLRHLLPFISIVPLGRELYLQLWQNGPLTAWSLTIVATLILVAIAWQCFRTIERLFISPIQAAKEKAREQIGALSVTLAQLDEMNGIVDGFVVDRMRYHAPQLTAARPQPPTLPVETRRKTYGELRAERIRTNGGSFTKQEWNDLLAKYNYRCVRCGNKRHISADHVIPVSLGGSSNIDNIQPLCRRCNSSKGARSSRDYRAKPNYRCLINTPKTSEMPTNIGIPETILDRPCPQCGTPLDAARFGAAQRWGYCSECKPVEVLIATNGHKNGNGIEY
jgi:hypothetical protein